MESVLLVAPITALEFVGDHLLAGEGPNLTVYRLQSGGPAPPRTRQSVLGGYTIHGIRPTEDARRLCVFGSKGLTVLKFSAADGGRVVDVSPAGVLRRLHDWIWDAQWLDAGAQAADPNLALALGHNSVALYDFDGGTVLREVHCAEKCVLYSARFVGRAWEELALVSGTVFNQLVVWGMCDRTDGDGRVAPRRRVGGHKGVIFSIFYGHGMLASASDDRSLRVWKVGDLAASEGEVQCLLVLYGHQSRVWSVRLLQESIVSVGEDSACIVWSYAGDIVHTFKGHKGRGIRAVAVHDRRGWVATGGADAGIRLWQIKGGSTASNGLLNLRFGSPDRTGAPKAIAAIDTRRLVVMTDAGSIYTHDLLTNQWAFVLADENYRSYSLLEVFGSSTDSLCAIGNITGSVKIFSLPVDGRCPELRLYDGKVHNLTWLPPPCLAPDRCHLFTSGPNGLMVWLEVIRGSGHGVAVSEKGRFALPACKQRWHTSVAFVPTENVIVCGDRRGSLMLFSSKVDGVDPLTSDGPPCAGSSVDSSAQPGSLLPTASGPPQRIEDPTFVLYGIHGKLGVTSVAYHDGFVYSTGRDGLYRQLKVEGGRLTVLRKLKSCKGMEWIERLQFTPDGGGSLHILGFHSTDFVVWSAAANEKLHCVPCGGGHRSWSYEKEGATEVFAYIKSGDVLAYRSQPAEKARSVLKEPLHGRELTCIKYAGNVTLKGKRVHVLITGSEDTTVSVLAFDEVSREIWQLSTIGDHLSSVRTLALAKTQSETSESGVLSCVLFTAGGRAQIECYRLLVRSQEDAGRVTCQVVHLASHRLDERWDKMKNKHRMVKVDPETRYMSLRALDDAALGPSSSSSRLFLAAACSDGSVRFFMMCEDARRIFLVAETFYHQRCVLKVEAFVHRSGDSTRVWLCSASTDGRIAFWDITRTVGCARKMLDGEHPDGQPQDLGPALSTLSVHQCGVNSLHVQKTGEGHFLLASGGDDNSVHIHELDPDGGQAGRVHVLRSFCVTSAHAAHVTGLRILRDDLLASASADQRLTLWRLSPGGLRHLTTRFCHVADVSELDCWPSDDDDGGHWCALCGQGLEIVVYRRAQRDIPRLVRDIGDDIHKTCE